MASPYRSHSVLVVDDQEFVLNIVSTMLKQIGFGEIVTSQDGTDALTAVEKSMPNLIICDINMKPMDGLSFLRNLRKSELPKSATVPIIFLTGDTSEKALTQAIALGCEQFLLKPVSPQKLRDKINQIFGAGEFDQTDQ